MMKSLSRRIVLAAIVTLTGLSFIGCDNSGESTYHEAYVLEGFMPIGHPISVRLTRTVDINQHYDESSVGVPGASVTVWESLNGDTVAFALIPDETGLPGTYTAPSAGDTVKSGYDYSIRIDVEGQVITAETHDAPQPISLDSCQIDSTVEIAGGRDTLFVRPVVDFSDSTNPVSMSYAEGVYFHLWYHTSSSNPELNFITENLEPDWYSNDDLAVSGNNGAGGSNVWFWTNLGGDSYRVPPVVLGYQGRYRVRAMICDSIAYEYFQVLFPGNPTSEPPSNVSGALGLFSIYDADTAYFCLTDPEADVVHQCHP